MNDPLVASARRRVDAEMRGYDLLSRRSKTRRIDSAYQESRRRDDVDASGPESGYVCGHKVSLCLPCDMCSRTQEDCRVYQVALQAKLRELVAKLTQLK